MTTYIQSIFIKITTIFLTLLFVMGSHAQAQTIELITKAPDGTPGDDSSYYASFSRNDQSLFIRTTARNLGPEIATYGYKLGLYNLTDKKFQYLNIGEAGQAYFSTASITDDNQLIAFASDSNNQFYVFNQATQNIQLISEGVDGNPSVTNSDFQSTGLPKPHISGDGRYVVFSTHAHNLVENDNNNNRDVFIKDLQSNTIKRISLTTNGIESDSWSESKFLTSDNKVIFDSNDYNLTHDGQGGPYVYDIDTGVLSSNPVAVIPTTSYQNNSGSLIDISNDGRFFLVEYNHSYPANGDQNYRYALILYDLHKQTSKQVYRTDDYVSELQNSKVSDDGRFVIIHTSRHHLLDNYSNADSHAQIFVKDLEKDTTTLVSLNDKGELSNGYSSWGMDISSDGRQIVFNSNASNLTPDVTNRDTEHMYHINLNNNPVANAGDDQAIYLGQTVRMDGSQSYDADGDKLTYEWSLHSQPANSHINFTKHKAKTYFKPKKVGEYTFKLTVTMMRTLHKLMWII